MREGLSHAQGQEINRKNSCHIDVCLCLSRPHPFGFSGFQNQHVDYTSHLNVEPQELRG